MSDMRLTNTSVVRAGGRLLARATSGARMLPGFLVIGTKRGGSTSLYEYLIRHPDVAGCLLTKGSHYFDVNFGRGWSWFRAAFPLAGGRRAIAGEASPYYMFHPLAPQRIAAALPEVRLIAVLRDPVERAWSHYRYERHRGYEDLPFEEALRREPERLAGEAERLERIHALIPPSRVLVLQSEALFGDTDAELERVWRFLGLEPFRIGRAPIFKAGGHGEAMPAPTRAWLERQFAVPNQELYRLPGIGFRWPEPAPATPAGAR